MFRCSKCSNSPIYQNFDIFDNWTRINCCTLWPWLSEATNNQNILDRTKWELNIIQHLSFWLIFEWDIQVDIKAVEQEILRLGFPDEGCDMGDADLDRHALRFKFITTNDILKWSQNAGLGICFVWPYVASSLRSWREDPDRLRKKFQVAQKINANTTGKKTKY